MNLENIIVGEKQPGTKGHILYNSSYMKNPEYTNTQRSKVGWWLPVAGGRAEWEVTARWHGISCGDENVVELISAASCSTL